MLTACQVGSNCASRMADGLYCGIHLLRHYPGRGLRHLARPGTKPVDAFACMGRPEFQSGKCFHYEYFQETFC